MKCKKQSTKVGNPREGNAGESKRCVPKNQRAVERDSHHIAKHARTAKPHLLPTPALHALSLALPAPSQNSYHERRRCALLHFICIFFAPVGHSPSELNDAHGRARAHTHTYTYTYIQERCLCTSTAERVLVDKYCEMPPLAYLRTVPIPLCHIEIVATEGASRKNVRATRQASALQNVALWLSSCRQWCINTAIQDVQRNRCGHGEKSVRRYCWSGVAVVLAYVSTVRVWLSSPLFM